MIKEVLETIKDKEVRYKVTFIVKKIQEIQEWCERDIISDTCSLKMQLVLKDELLKLTVNNNERN